jgi:hypothetical protein
MLSVSPCRTRTTVPSMHPAAVICRSRSASCPELATVLLRGRAAVICRGSQPQQDPGVVRYVQAVGDALEDVGLADAPDAIDDFAHPALAQADRSADARLTEPEVLLEQPEQRAHVAVAQGLADVVAFPQGGRYRRRVECARTHSVPSIVLSPGAHMTGCDQQHTRHLTVRTPSVMGS